MIMATSVKRKDKRASRITTACNPCRSRKQKCSGERPTCEQCIEYRRVCAWPEQLKRGPAKGYIEALESRLYETENVLLKILSHLSQPQLQSMLSQDVSGKGNRKQDKRAAHALASSSRKHGVEYWKAFPLSSAQNIRRWEQDCHLERSTSGVSDHDADILTPTRRFRRNKTTEATDVDSMVEASPTTVNSHDNIDLDRSFEGFQDQTGYRQQHSVVGDSQGRVSSNQLIATALPPPISPHNYYSPSSQLTQHSKEHITTSHAYQQLSTWEAAPSINFQKQFLW